MRARSASDSVVTCMPRAFTSAPSFVNFAAVAGTTGTRYFATDTRGTIFFNNTTSFGTAAIPAAATPLQ